MGEMRAFYEVLKAVYKPTRKIQAPLRSSDGSALLADKEATLQAGQSISKASSATNAPYRSLHWPKCPKWA